MGSASGAREGRGTAEWSIALTPRGWACALGAFALGVGWYAVGLRDVWYLAWLLGALVVVSLVSAAAVGGRARFEVRVRADEPAPPAGSTVQCTAAVAHRLPWAARGRVRWVAGGRGLTLPLVFERGSPAVASSAWPATARGPLEVEVAAVGVVDPLGLVRVESLVRTAVSVLVLPRPLPGAAELLDAGASEQLGEGAGVAASGTGDGAVGSGALREYRTGDASRQINWKQSARQGSWLVNLPEPVTRSERALRLDCTADAYRSAAEFEIAVSAATAVVDEWTRSGHLVTVQLPPQPPVASDAAEPLLRALARAQLVRAQLARDTRGDRAGGPRPTFEAAPHPAHVDGPLPAVVVTGTAGSRLRSALAASPVGGVLLTVGAAPDDPLPAGWRSIHLPREPTTRREAAP